MSSMRAAAAIVQSIGHSEAETMIWPHLAWRAASVIFWRMSRNTVRCTLAGSRPVARSQTARK